MQETELEEAEDSRARMRAEGEKGTWQGSDVSRPEKLVIGSVLNLHSIEHSFSWISVCAYVCMCAYVPAHAWDFGAVFRCRGQTLNYFVKYYMEKTFVVDQQVQRGPSRNTLSSLLLGDTSGGTVKLLLFCPL